MRLRHLLLTALLVPASLASADEFDGRPTLTNEDKAAIQADQDAKHKAIDDKYKDDNSSEARAAKMRDYDQADREVLQEHHVSQHDFTVQDSQSSPDDRAQIAQDKQAIEDKRKQDAEAAKQKKAAAPAEPQVIKGFDENHPLDVAGPDANKPADKPKLDENGNPVPTVEKLNPADDPNAGLTGPGPDAAPAPAPTRSKKHGGGHHRGRSRGE